jgi:uncharacterized Zn finger protein
MNAEIELQCSACGETDNLHINYNHALPAKPVESVLCNECGEITDIEELV